MFTSYHFAMPFHKGLVTEASFFRICFECYKMETFVLFDIVFSKSNIDSVGFSCLFR